MSDFKITQEVLDRLNAAFETDSAKGMVRLVEIVRNATDDPLVAKSKMALDMIEVMLGVLLTDHIITTNPHEPIERLAKAVESVQQKARATKPRNRKPSPGSGKSFTAAVKKASGKYLAHLALVWLEKNADETFEGFDILGVDNGQIRYKFARKEHELSAATFKAYWRKTSTRKK